MFRQITEVLVLEPPFFEGRGLYRVFFNEEFKVSGWKSIQNSVLYADFELIFFVIVANLIM